jgi:hypothetical protein
MIARCALLELTVARESMAGATPAGGHPHASNIQAKPWMMIMESGEICKKWVYGGWYE